MKNGNDNGNGTKAGTKPATAGKAKAASSSKPAAKQESSSKAKGKAKGKAAEAPPEAPAADPADALPAKQYKLAADQLQAIATGYGACIASDKITVDGQPVRFMYREEAVHEDDSGWRFFSGTESDAYMEEPSNHAFYDCNTIANYDRSVVPLLGSPVGSVFEKPPGATDFEQAADLASDDSEDDPEEDD
jgi:hypothetical protein